MKNIFFIVTILITIVFASCKENDECTIKVVDTVYVDSSSLSYGTLLNIEIRELMNEVYLWYDQLDEIGVSEYFDPYSYMRAMRVNPPDKWSFVITMDDYYALFQSGSAGLGHGFSLGEDANNNIRIIFCYATTDAYLQGVRRGWIIHTVDGSAATFSNVFDLLDGQTNTIEFINHSQDTVELTLTKEDITITPVLHSEVISYDRKKIGYMVFTDFIESAYEPLDTTFESFKTQGIDELIIDLRYNGGGASSVANFLISHLLDDVTNEDVFTHYAYNDIYGPYWDDYDYFMEPGDTLFRCNENDICDEIILKDNRLSLNRVLFITTDNTASASEMVINGLKPYLGAENVILFGSTTHGKPVGMNGFASEDEEFLFFPVTFSYDNASGEGDFYEGIPVNYSAADDYTHKFGDPEETSLAAALEYISTGTVLKKASIQGRYLGGIANRPQNLIHINPKVER